MKLSICLLIISVQVSAAAFSQSITLNVKNASLESVIKKIEKQSGYSFVYKTELLRQNPATISVVLKNASLDQALKESLKDQPLTYVIVYKTVVIKPKSVAPINSNTDAPKRPVHGKVTDANNRPMPGVTVRVDGTDLAVITDGNGNYSLELTPGSYRLIFSSIGFETRIIEKTLSNNGDLALNVVLSAKVTLLQQAVVVGYSTKKADEITGALQTFNTQQLEGVTSNNIISDLKGKVLGMYITEPSGDPNQKPSFVVRGQGTIPIQNDPRVVNNLNPLVVIDGIIYPDITNPSDIVSSTDIQSITILRDAASTAIYGSRASQGVIVITTKKGVAGHSELNINSSFGFSQRYTGKLKFMDTQQLYDYQKQMLINSYAVNTEGLTEEAYLTKYLPNSSVLGTNTNWNDLIYRDGLTKTVDMSLSGGDEITRYYFGANNYDEDGALKGNDLKRTSFKLNLDHNVTKQFVLSANLSAIFDTGDASPVYSTGVTDLPWYTPNNADGSPKEIMGTDVLGNTTINPLYDLPYNSNITKTQQLLGVFSAKYKPTDWLSVSSNNSYNTTFTDNENYTDALSVEGAYNNGSLIQTKTDANSFLTSNLITARKQLGLNNVGGLGGFEFSHSNSEYNALAVQNLPTGIKVPSAASQPYYVFNGNAYEGEKFTRGSYSVFAEGDYNYDERYYFNSSYRMDYSDNFGLDNRAGHFYSLSGAWLLSHEDFLKQNKVITNLKLRGSYGTTGKVAGEDFLTESFYNFGYQYNSNPAAVINQLGNNSITWEKAYVLNEGIDLGLFNRISITADVYRKRTTGLLQDVTVSALLGVPNQYQNVGQMVNHGVELQFSSQNLVGRFKWQTQFNISFNKNKIEKLGATVSGVPGILKVGEDIASVNQVKWLGVDPQTGKPEFERLIFDKNMNVVGHQVVNSYDAVFAGLSGAAAAGQFQYIGNTTPKYFGGISNTFSYDRVELSILLNFAEGYLVYNNQQATYFSSEGNNILQYNQILPSAGQSIWQKPGDIATEPMPIRNRTDGADEESSRYWEDASHIRVRNIRLSYSLPENLLSKLRVKNAKVYLSGDDLFIFTRKSFYGVDPEGGLGGDVFSYNLGTGYGASRKYLMGLQLSFN